MRWQIPDCTVQIGLVSNTFDRMIPRQVLLIPGIPLFALRSNVLPPQLVLPLANLRRFGLVSKEQAPDRPKMSDKPAR